MAIKDPFVSFFQKRKKDAEENIRKVKDFKQRFIAEPLQKIPELVTDDLFKAKKEAKKFGENYMKTANKIKDFQTKYFARPLVQAAQTGKELLTGGAEQLPFVRPIEKKTAELGTRLGVRKPGEFKSAYDEQPTTTTGKVLRGTGAVASNIGQFVVAGKLATSLIDKAGKAFLTLRGAKNLGSFDKAAKVA